MHGVIAASYVFAVGAANADVATFDSFPEGAGDYVMTDGGIRFSNLDRRLDGVTAPSSFVIENAANVLRGQPGFTGSNALGFGVYSPGLPVTFGRLGSFDITPARPAGRISLHLYVYGQFTGRAVALALTNAGASVDAQTIPMVNGEGLHHYVFDMTAAAFDGARLSVGPGATDYIFALVDTVAVEDALPPACRADWDHSGTVNSTDFFAFLNDFFAGSADINADGATTSSDFFEFLQFFFAGC
jgi:hypothetical protein